MKSLFQTSATDPQQVVASTNNSTTCGERKSTKNDTAQQTKTSLPEWTSILHLYSPKHWTDATIHQVEVVKRQAPTVGSLDRIYGRGHAAEWLLLQLRALVAHTTERNAGVQAELIDFAPDFVADCGGMKLTEMMVFFSGFRCGRFGGTYGLTSARAVGLAFRQDFLPHIMRLREKVLHSATVERNESAPMRNPLAVTYEEFLQMKEFRVCVTVRYAEAWKLVRELALTPLPDSLESLSLPAEVAMKVDRKGLTRLGEEEFKTRWLKVRSI